MANKGDGAGPLVPGGSRGGGQAFEAGAAVQDRETGRFASGGGLTDRQRAFVSAYVENGGRASQAVREAGYAEASVRTMVYSLLRNPAVVAEIRRTQAARVQAEGVTVGVGTLIEVARDKGQTGAARVSAATRLVEMAGFLPRHGHGGAAREAEQKAPSEMSVTELDAIASQLAEAMTRAKIAAAGGDPGDATLKLTRNDDDQGAES